MPRDIVPEMDLVIVRAVLKGTSIKIALVLTPIQYVHFQFLGGELVNESMPMDQEVVGEVAALLEHLK